MSKYVQIHTYVFMYIGINVCVKVCMYVNKIRIYVWRYECMYVCT